MKTCLHPGVFKLLIFSVLLSCFFTSCQHNASKENAQADYSNGKFIADWNSKLTESIVQDLFTPPVASRIYAYSHLAAYEVLRFSDTKAGSLAAKLHGFKAIPEPGKDTPINYTLAALTAFSTVGQKLVYTESVLKDYQAHILDSMQKAGLSKEEADSSVSYGKKVAAIILQRAGSDMFKETRGMPRYKLVGKPGSYKPTPPDYTPAVEPYWNKIHPFALDSASEFRPDTIMPFSTEKNSRYYNAAMEVLQINKGITDDEINCAKFWDCNPNVSDHEGHLTVMNQKMTPGGHWMEIVTHVVKHKHLSQLEATHTYALTAIGIADAFIACWDSKYTFNTIRPVTYIQENIQHDWMPPLQTPPFPEFPSGHSTISASAAYVLTNLFGDHYVFTDSSELYYGMPVRTEQSFIDAANEVAISRLYGGIHFRYANVIGQQIGFSVAKKLLSKTK